MKNFLQPLQAYRLKSFIVFYILLITFRCFGQEQVSGTYSAYLVMISATNDSTIVAPPGGRYSIKFKTDGSYISHSPSCTNKTFTPGRWQKNKDTLILNSDRQKTKSPVKEIQELHFPDSSFIRIKVVDKYDQPVFYEHACIYKDSLSKMFRTHHDGTMDFNLTSIDSIRFTDIEDFFNVNGTYIPENPISNFFILKLNVTEADYLYDYKKNEKYLIAGPYLYPLFSVIDYEEEEDYKEEDHKVLNTPAGAIIFERTVTYLQKE